MTTDITGNKTIRIGVRLGGREAILWRRGMETIGKGRSRTWLAEYCINKALAPAPRAKTPKSKK